MRDVLAGHRGRGGPRAQPVALATVVETWGSAPRAVGGEDGADAPTAASRARSRADASRARSSRPGGRRSRRRQAASPPLRRRGRDGLGGRPRVRRARSRSSSSRSTPQAFDALRRTRSTGERAGRRRPPSFGGPEELLGRTLLRFEGRRSLRGSIGAGLERPPPTPRASAIARTRRRPGASRRRARPASSSSRRSGRRRRSSSWAACTSPSRSSALARTLGFRTIVVDPRSAPSATRERFPARRPARHRLARRRRCADLGLNPSTAVAVLTHDPKLDDPALAAALPSVRLLRRRARQQDGPRRSAAAPARGRHDRGAALPSPRADRPRTSADGRPRRSPSRSWRRSSPRKTRRSEIVTARNPAL